MTETQVSFGLLWAVLTWGAWVLLYRLGGWKAKVFRRWIGGLGFPLSFMGLASYLHHFSWWMAGSLILFPCWLSLGYGANELSKKFAKRLSYGMMAGVAVAPLLLSQHLFAIWYMQLGLSVMATVYYGLQNPLSTTGEEGILGGLYVILTIFAPLR